MGYALLTASVLFLSLQNILSKQYNTKTKKANPFFYSAISAVFALLFFVAVSKFKLNFNTGLLPYSAGFAFFYGAALIGSVFAIRKGPLSVTALILSYSLIIPTLYGIILLKEPISTVTYIGIGLLLISLFLINIKREDVKFSLLWIVFVIISFIGNGMCSTVQKMQQISFDGAYKSEFMIIALAISSIALFIMGCFVQGDKKKMLNDCVRYAPLQGIANGVVNMSIMLLVGMLPNSVIFPTVSAGGIVLTFIVSVTIFREKLSKFQLLGYIMGIVSIILLNI